MNISIVSKYSCKYILKIFTTYIFEHSLIFVMHSHIYFRYFMWLSFCFYCNKHLKLPVDLIVVRSGGGVVDNTLDYQSRGRKIDPPLLRSFG